jgi:hypothetical protein
LKITSLSCDLLEWIKWNVEKRRICAHADATPATSPIFPVCGERVRSQKEMQPAEKEAGGEHPEPMEIDKKEDAPADKTSKRRPFR